MGSKDRIRAFILEHTDQSELRDDEDIFDSGLVRSMFVLQLVLFVEQDFGVSVSGGDLTFDSFRTVNAVNDLVMRKLAR